MTGKAWVESLTLKEQHDKMEELMNKEALSIPEMASFSALIYTYLRRVHQASESHGHVPPIELMRFG